ncbi:MAG TPA: hypothetical protein VF717_01905, partial [Pyrinomonadaceae bacterium]
MRLTSLIFKTLLGAVLLFTSLPVAAQGSRQNQGPPPPPKAPAYRIASDASAPAGWNRYEFGAGPVVSALLPSRPEEFKEIKSLGASKPSTMYTYISDAEGAVYGVYYGEDMPFIAERMPESFRQGFYEGMLKGFIEGVKQGLAASGLLFEVNVGSRRQTKVDGLDGNEFDFGFGPMSGLARMT